MNSPRIGGGRPAAASRVAGLGSPTLGGAAAAAPTSAVAAGALQQIQYQSTWPRGWMAAAVPQRVREFHTQISKAQLALAFLAQLDAKLAALAQTSAHQRKLASEAGAGRLRQALQAVQRCWAQRLGETLGSLDEALHWSPVHAARKQFALAGWDWERLDAEHDQDTELVSFSLLGQDGAHGAWQASWERPHAASRHVLAAALAPLGVQLVQGHEALLLSVDERLWPTVLQRLAVKGNGQRFPAGQWVQPKLQAAPQALDIAYWSAVDEAAQALLDSAIAPARTRVAKAQAAVQAFQDHARQSLEDTSARIAATEQFSLAFAQAGQAPVYDWVLAVVPAVRAVSRRRVARLMQSRGALS